MPRSRSDQTGPGLCEVCREFRERVAKGMCNVCYQRHYYGFDPKAYAGRQEAEYRKAPKTLINILYELKRLRECGILEPLEYVNLRKIIDGKLQGLRAIDNEEAEQITSEEDMRARVQDEISDPFAGVDEMKIELDALTTGTDNVSKKR